jgi:hypothetical protein
MIRLAIITWLVDRCLDMVESELLDAFDMESSVDISNMVVGRSYRIQLTSRFVRYLKQFTSNFGHKFMGRMYDRINSSDVYIFTVAHITYNDIRVMESIRGEIYLGGELIYRNFVVLPSSLRYVAEL